ncbi:Rv2175c family DNA-binding protein [Kitasatospora sp. DSM 101779]|uniref:Rv2175c family DNA-binding protein n=1 Tax=Kitasatospora sp. DSM 101779 TaxID=2853165 RepID=UPI0021D8E616|nr:Rv2175c family DNA-binding protein [Kitasatospora sp. DSM 101779]MCU7825237.1 DNA-binding protein [Kitasatospora sp. DSM 101779]
MSEIDPKIDALVPAWMYLPDISELWGVQVTEVRNMVKSNTLLAVRRGENKSLQVPAAFITPEGPVKHLIGTLTVLRDSGFSDEEILEWLFTEDPSLPGSPIQALHENRATEVKRRAQAMAL